MADDAGNQWFGALLLDWYAANGRTLPWRQTRDPYKIWLSEVILQQTRVEQGLPYYLRFVEHYPTVTHLAGASEDDVLKDWQGLGYYSRARNLHAAAKHVASELGGLMPQTYEGLKALKGVGDYTAADIAALAYGLPHAAVDGNVYRVLSRVFGISTPIDSAQGKKEFAWLAAQLVSYKRPGDFNQALMDFGATVCTPKNQLCEACPFGAKCFALGANKIAELPVKSKKTQVRDRYFHYFCIRLPNGRLVVNQRRGKDIWTGLFDFPLVESATPLTAAQLLETEDFLALKRRAKGLAITRTGTEKKHQLSHQTLHATLYHCTAEEISTTGNESVIATEDFEKLAVPRLIELLIGTATKEKQD